MSRNGWHEHANSRLLERLATEDADHARLHVECPRCKDTFTAYTWLRPDPEQRAKRINDDKVASWSRSHPCYQTTASQRKRAAA